MLRRTLQAAARRGGPLRKAVERMPSARAAAGRYVAGETVGEVLLATRILRSEGMLVSVDRLGDDVTDRAEAESTVQAYERLLQELPEGAEVSLRLGALGVRFDEALAYACAERICEAAAAAGTTVTIDMEDHGSLEATRRVVDGLRFGYPATGAVVQSSLRRSEEYCAELSHAESRVRLCKGSFPASSDVAFTDREEIDRSFVRCLRVLMAGEGYPMIATHDPRLLEIVDALRIIHDRPYDSFEYQMFYGVRPDEQRRLADSGARMRVYVPYGGNWYPYVMRRMSEHPADLRFLLRGAPT
ncbi:proline dehydrogenase family protein [Actinocorallia sp. A-T 12471]|uniref:proline dehydrogenase family protein n=1 Tax=Actinocorallia sp. A-T 12471 TaxID=3089813 RepID=UPI0029D34B64|nr:proline dehydrogenase family protein [Actinocorallia sp. A-T 12471]MDX6741790.1 proline dehydrogenase family protein [Actinocorallia sp. A-T 12471]